MPSLGPLEILVVAIVAVLVFPPDKLPDIARKVGRAIRDLRRFQGNLSADLERMMDEPDPPPKLPPRDGPTPDESAPDASAPDASAPDESAPGDRAEPGADEPEPSKREGA